MVWETVDFAQVKDVIAGKDIGVPLKAEKPKKSDDAPTGETKVDSTTIKTPEPLPV
jgi:hypothetical protein